MEILLAAQSALRQVLLLELIKADRARIIFSERDIQLCFALLVLLLSVLLDSAPQPLSKLHVQQIVGILRNLRIGVDSLG